MYNEFYLLKKARKFFRLCAGRSAFPPEDISIELSTVCDRNCSVCFREALPLEHGFMDLETFRLVAERILDACGTTKPDYLNLVGLGEPFLNPAFPDILRHIRAAMPGTRINVSSNLVSAPDDTLKTVLEQGLIDRLSVSVDLPEGGRTDLHTFTHFLRTRLKSVARQAAAGGKKLSVRVHTLIISRDQVLKILGICAETGVDILHLIRLNTHHLPSPKPPRVTKREEMEILRFARREAAKAGITVWNNNVFNIFMHAASRLDRICLLSDDHIFINAQAEVLPCFLLRGMKFGSLKDQSLREIFLHPAKKGFYSFQRNLCGGCDVYKNAHHH